MNKFFARYLIVYGVGLMIIWIIFSALVLPLLPDKLAGGLTILGLGSCVVVWACLVIQAYERKYPDDE